MEPETMEAHFTRIQLPTELANGPALMSAARVCRFAAFSRSTLYKMVDEGRFPPAVQIATRRVAWKREEVISWYLDLQTAALRREAKDEESEVKTDE